MNPVKAIQSARAALDKGDLARLHSLCEPLVADDQHGPEARKLLAQAHFLDAASWFRKKRLRLAHLRCRLALSLDPTLARAEHLLGIIDWSMGLPSQGLEHLRRAADLQPQWPVAKTDLAQALQTFPTLPAAARGAPHPGPGAGPRYLLIKAWGAGFFSEVSHVLSHCLLAEISGRIPLVHWGDDCLFTDPGDEDGFRRFFTPLSDLTRDTLPTAKGDIFPPKWTTDNLWNNHNRWEGPDTRLGPIDLLGRAEPLLVSDFFVWPSELKPWIPKDHALYGKSVFDIHRQLIQKYLTPVPQITRRVDAFRRERLPNGYVAVHIRGSDKAVEQDDLKAVNRKYKGLIKKAMDRLPGHKLFVLTDSEAELERLEKTYGDRVVSASCVRTRGKVGVHFLNPQSHSQNRSALGEEVLLDVLLAVEADHFIGNNGSNISRFIREHKNWRNRIDMIGNYDYEEIARPLLSLVGTP